MDWKFVLTFISVLLFKDSFSQSDRLNFTHYSGKEGLLTGSSLIVQDDKGFIWIAGLRGIQRFDGNNFENFSEIIFKKEPYRIISMESHNGDIWVGTETQGLFRYNPKENTSTHYSHVPENRESISDNFVSAIYIDPAGNFWVGTWFGLSKLNVETGVFKNYLFETPKSKTVFNYSKVEKITSTTDGAIWVGTWGGGLHRFDPETETFRHFESIDHSAPNKIHWVKDIHVDGSWLWIATIGDGLFKFDSKSLQSEKIIFFPESISQGYKRLLSIIPRNTDELWIGSEEGLIRYNKNKGNYNIVKDNGPKANSLIHRNVEKIFKDNHKGVWILAGGINYYNYEASKFLLYQSSNGPGVAKDNEVFGFLEIGPDQIWISRSSGLVNFNPINETFQKAPGVFPGIPHEMRHTQNGNIAAISLRDGLSFYNPKDQTTTSYRFGDDLSQSLNSNVLFNMVEDRAGNLWISSNNALSCFRISDKKFIHFTGALEYTKGLKANSVHRIIIDDKDRLWVFQAKEAFLLSYLDSTLLKAGGPVGIINDTTKYAFETKLKGSNFRHTVFYEGAFYVVGQNIMAFDENGAKRVIVDDEDLINREVKSIILDDEHGLWIATNIGLSYLNLNTKELTNFYENDGVQANGFNNFSIYKTSNGDIYAGGNNGFNIIKPSEIELNSFTPPIVISQIRIFNKPIPIKPSHKTDEAGSKEKKYPLKKSISYENEIIINHDQNLVALEFAALNFLYPQENQYAYMIEGVDKDWNYITGRNLVNYNNLPEGKWLKFKVKGSNNNGIWNPEETTLMIFVKPPFYNTIWFKYLAAIGIIGIALSIYFIRVKQLKTQRRKLEIQVEQRTQEIKSKQEEISLQNKKLTEQSRELKIQNSNTLLFSEMGKKITASISLEEIFEKIYHLLNNIVDASHLAIGEINDDENAIEYWEIVNGKISNQTILLNDETRLSVYAYKRKTPIFSNNLKEDVNLYLSHPDSQYQRDPINSAIYIPLQSPTNKNIGLLVVKSKKRNAFEQKNVNLLKNIAVYVSIALDNSSKYKKIQQQSEKLAELDRIKTRFYSNISHEFRTPLSLILGPAEELRKDQALTVKEREYLDIIQHNGNRLLRLVTQIMDLSKLEDGVLRLEVAEGDLFKTLNTIIESFSFLAEKKQIQLKTHNKTGSLIGYFDKDKIEKIAYNLLNNAFKYTDPGQQVTVTIEHTKDQKQNRFLELTVSDTGIGMSSSEVENIFEQYYRVDNRHTQSVFGAGIGLTLVKKLVSLHYGSLEVKSVEGEGTEFKVILPIDRSAYKPGEIVEEFINNPDRGLNFANDELVNIALPEVLTSKKKRKVLIVEDNQELLKFIADTLSEDFEIMKAENGKEALDLLEKEKAEIIISDVMMPLMNGFELCKKIKTTPETSHIPVILLTAKNSEKDQFSGLTHGANEYIGKPVNIDILKLKIHNLLKNYDSIKSKYENTLIGDIDKLEVSDNHKDFVRSVIKILEENITKQELNIDFFANELGVSRTLLYEKIKKATGESLGAFIKKSRLNYSAKLLLENHFNTSELAYEVGFSDPKYFSKCFRKHFGKTPKEFLKSKVDALKYE